MWENTLRRVLSSSRKVSEEVGYGYDDAEKGDFLMVNADVGIPIDVKLYLMLDLSGAAPSSSTFLISSVSAHPLDCNLLSLIAIKRA